MKYTIIFFFLLAGCLSGSCKRFTVDQTVLTGLHPDNRCGVFTDIWDNKKFEPFIVRQFELPCDCTDSARQADLRKAQAIADILNKANR